MSPLRLSPGLFTFSIARKWATYFVFATSATIFLNDNLLELTTVDGSSMAPTLSPTHHSTGKRDYVLWQKWSATRNLRRGDIVHFMNPSNPESLAVKRVVALEGDTVMLDPRRRPQVVRGNGAQSFPVEKAWDAWHGRVEVPPGHVWLEGDNWRASKDSNYYGPVSKSLITGRALWVILPWQRMGGTPWYGFNGATKVLVGDGRRGREWTVDGLPIELMETSGEAVIPRQIQAAQTDNTSNSRIPVDKCKSRRWSG